ncbi:hypothetical protein [Hymenobacter ruricola]|uniref:Lipoprotein n=1 Tax=Hymenobacter ruricola TaxID=2791023 RepID=A0ABS0IBL2_9BACT|nr:hypothetical protein [Hymenobacter ruricola]MBF9224317.1 hypothetical protein [Hymenobacter ruricola]
MGACSKDSSDSASTGVGGDGMSWTVDGKTETAVFTTGGLISLGNLPLLTVVGKLTNGSGGTMTTLNMGRGVGTYPLAASATTGYSAAYTVSAGENYIASGGSATLTTYAPSATAGESHVVGTFTFTGTDPNGTGTKTVTNGKFDIKF